MRLANNLPGGESDGAVLGEWSRDLDLASDWLLAVLVDQSGEKLISRDKPGCTQYLALPDIFVIVLDFSHSHLVEKQWCPQYFTFSLDFF